MELLDKENHQETYEYTIIGGYSSNLTRIPSTLGYRSATPSPNTSHAKCLRCQGTGRVGTGLSKSSSNSSGSEEVDAPSPVAAAALPLRWDEEEVMSWLKEKGFHIYENYFKKHAVNCGESLLALEEEHLKEMGIFNVGHRLKIMRVIDDLRREVGLVSRANYVDISYLISQMNSKQWKDTVELYPKRIILIRHGESEGNVENSLYAVKPDRKMELTPKGVKQAYAAGVALKQLVQEESTTFYVSPFVRSRQTYEYIRQSFHDEQVIHVREDPRIREQEWGNFQDPSTMKEVMVERRKIGSFYYRFLTGESGADVYDRVSTFLETMYRDMEKGGCGENAILVSHGLFCRLFLMRYYHWRVEKFHKLWNFENCQYAVMEKQPGGKYRLTSELKSDL